MLAGFGIRRQVSRVQSARFLARSLEFADKTFGSENQLQLQLLKGERIRVTGNHRQYLRLRVQSHLAPFFSYCAQARLSPPLLSPAGPYLHCAEPIRAWASSWRILVYKKGVRGIADGESHRERECNFIHSVAYLDLFCSDVAHTHLRICRLCKMAIFERNDRIDDMSCPRHIPVMFKKHTSSHRTLTLVNQTGGQTDGLLWARSDSQKTSVLSIFKNKPQRLFLSIRRFLRNFLCFGDQP